MNNKKFSLHLRRNEEPENYDLFVIEHIKGEEELRYIWNFSNVYDALRKAEDVQEESGDGHLTGVHLFDFSERTIPSSEAVFGDATEVVA